LPDSAGSVCVDIEIESNPSVLSRSAVFKKDVLSDLFKNGLRGYQDSMMRDDSDIIEDVPIHVNPPM